MEVPRDVYIRHIDTGHHDLGGCLVVEVDNLLKELLLLRLMSLKQIDRLRELIDREVVPTRLHTPSHQTRRAHQEAGEGREQLGDHTHLRRGEATEGQRMCLCIHLGDNLSKE